jgi:hypothetical protein
MRDAILTWRSATGNFPKNRHHVAGQAMVDGCIGLADCATG